MKKVLMITSLAATIAAIVWTIGPASDSTQVVRAQAGTATEKAASPDNRLYELTLPEAVISAPQVVDKEIVLPEVVIKAEKKIGA